jgi:hypothetical protein
MAMNNGVTQLDSSTDSRVFAEIILDSRNGSILDMLWRREMRLTRSKIHDIDTLLAQLVSFSNHGHSGGRFDAVDAFSQLDGRSLNGGTGFGYGSHARFPVFIISTILFL